jgi:hypothetical protein
MKKRFQSLLSKYNLHRYNWVHRSNEARVKTEPPGDWVDVEQRRVAAGVEGFTTGMPQRADAARRNNKNNNNNNMFGGRGAAPAESEEEEWMDAMEELSGEGEGPCPWVEQPPSNGRQEHWLHILTGEIAYDPPMVGEKWGDALFGSFRCRGEGRGKIKNREKKQNARNAPH